LEDVGPAADCVAVGIVLREFVGWEVAVDLDRAEGLDGVGGVADFVAVGLLGVGGFVAASWHCPSGFSFKYYEITQTNIIILVYAAYTAHTSQQPPSSSVYQKSPKASPSSPLTPSYWNSRASSSPNQCSSCTDRSLSLLLGWIVRFGLGCW
jgi:hypothetical protein